MRRTLIWLSVIMVSLLGTLLLAPVALADGHRVAMFSPGVQNEPAPSSAAPAASLSAMETKETGNAVYAAQPTTSQPLLKVALFGVLIGLLLIVPPAGTSATRQVEIIDDLPSTITRRHRK